MTTAPSRPDLDSNGHDVLPGHSPSETGAHRRDFTRLSVASAVSQLGTMGVAVANPLLALTLTGSPIFAGYVTAATVVPGLVLHLPAGLLVDRVDRRKVMVMSQALRVLAAVILCFSLVFSCNPALFLIIVALVDGSCAAFYEVAEIASVPYLVPENSLDTAISRNEARLNISMIIGRPLGGALFAIHPAIPYALDAATSVIPIVALMGLVRTRQFQNLTTARSPVHGKAQVGVAPDDRPTRTRESPIEAIGSALRLVTADLFSRSVLGACVIANFCFQILVLLQIVLAKQGELPSSFIGLLLASSGLGGFLGAVVAPWVLRKRSPRFTAVCCVFLWVPMVWILAWSGNPIIGLAIWGLCSLMGAHINVALKSHQAKTVPGELLGRVTGITRFLSVGAVALGALIGGWVINWLGVSGTSISAVGVFIAIAVGLPLILIIGTLDSVRTLLIFIQVMCRYAVEWIARFAIGRIKKPVAHGLAKLRGQVLVSRTRSNMAGTGEPATTSRPELLDNPPVDELVTQS